MIRRCYEEERVKRIVIGSGGSAFVDGGLGAV
jgi:glycerate kinase